MPEKATCPLCKQELELTYSGLLPRHKTSPSSQAPKYPCPGSNYTVEEAEFVRRERSVG